MRFSESHLQQTVRQGVSRMKARRQAERKLAELAREYPEMAAREMLVFAGRERNHLRRQLQETFGFSVSRERSGFRCRFAAPERRPRTPEEAATWIDAVVALAGFETALDGMPSGWGWTARVRTGAAPSGERFPSGRFIVREVSVRRISL